MAKLLVIAAHPDDELFAGGYIAQRAAEGDEVSILCTTRGEGGEVGDLGLVSKEQLGAVREGEMRRAGAALGAREVFFLDFVDPHMEIDGLAQPIDATLEEFTAAIRAYLQRLQPDAILTHGSNGEYGHPQHIYTHRAVWAALAELAPWQPRELLTWCASYPDPPEREKRLLNQDDPADLVLDITPWLDTKVAGYQEHVTQHAMFRRNSGIGELRDMVRRTESLRRWPTDAPIVEAGRWAETGRPGRPAPKDMSRRPPTPAPDGS